MDNSTSYPCSLLINNRFMLFYPIICFYAGIMDLLNQRTPNKFLACRLTPDMERKILFLTSKVKNARYKFFIFCDSFVFHFNISK